MQFTNWRGIFSYINQGQSVVEHYKAYCKRINNSWEVYDDLTIKSKLIKASNEVLCDFILYTIKSKK